ncbi:hypothetical protein ACRALDRAFT_2079759, partial [Sodiomyces alcalophilus JCM 7366]|uniref:uncharacterized protein n=1 Tax=Sodiomyces alcalophilus JCM 7366 TaxID=591952 RepID=UPI0039B69FB8
SDNANANSPPNDVNRRRRGSVTQQALAGLFRNNTTGAAGTNFPTPDAHRRRLSISTTGLGIAGTSVANSATFSGSYRRGSMSTNSDSVVDESAIDEDEGSSRTAPTTPFVRRMSFGGPAMRTPIRSGGVSPGSLNDQGFNWSEQLRSRAESSVQGPRPSFTFGSTMSTSPPRGNGQPANAAAAARRDRAKSVAEMPAPPTQASSVSPRPPEPERRKPDAFQERILKGDFYMD